MTLLSYQNLARIIIIKGPYLKYLAQEHAGTGGLVTICKNHNA